MAADTGAPSLVALAAAFRSLEVAATHVRGVCEWPAAAGQEMLTGSWRPFRRR